jgi:hypothetical protein
MPGQSVHGSLAGFSDATDGCCQPVIVSGPFAVGVQKHALPTEWDNATVFAATLTPINEAPSRSACLDRDCHGPPPTNAVILFLHLTI